MCIRDRGVPLATGALKTCRTNVVGAGLRLKSQIDYEALGMDEETARDLERKIEREFSLWADSPACDLERLDNFYELQQLAFLNWLMSGDVIATLPVTKRVNCPYDLRICLIAVSYTHLDVYKRQALKQSGGSGREQGKSYCDSALLQGRRQSNQNERAGY